MTFSELNLLDQMMINNEFDVGMALLRANRFQEAIWHFDNTLQILPDDKYAHWNKAMALLSMGEYEQGFKEHDVAWTLFDWRGFGPVRDDIDRLRKLPLWEGEECNNLLVYHELGFGDAIQCMRYLPALKKKARITLVINPELEGLVRSHWDGIHLCTSVPNNLAAFDYRAPFFGVMSALRQRIDNIPSAPYLAPREWRRVKGNVGVVWSGRTNNFKSSEFFSLLRTPGRVGDCVTFYSLQPGLVDASFVKPLEARNFEDTAKVISTMEHIITVDTGVAHLAGAMGHPSTHVLLPFQGDWRWWNSEVWYPLIKTYRQKTPGDWSGPFKQLNEALSHGTS